MAASNDEIEYEYPSVIRIYKNGHVERLRDTDFVPAGTDPQTGVSSKDVNNIVPETVSTSFNFSISVCSMQMAASNDEIEYEYPSVIRIYKNGHVERLRDTDFVPAGTDPQTGVSSKDVNNIVPETGVYVRIYLPNLSNKTKKIPVVVYCHGGVSVHYRLAPEHSIPIAYDDSWAALQWVISHSNGDGPEEWLNNYADFGRLFLSGDSAGANIAHNLAMRIGNSELGQNVKISGIALVHPYFWGSNIIGSDAVDPNTKLLQDRLWPTICPSNPDNDDPRNNPMAEGGPGLTGLGCKRVLVCVAEKDFLKLVGLVYFEALGRSGWKGVVELVETEGEGHAFHLYDLQCDKAKELMTRMAAFFNN
ncbi:unnamed protein product [Fraxinus pennsylvanica]|uniref:Alpha/beta hydrolase fold-3 domain-containing protein n=1 Tax=Fraxinus pennsylvanica TaxID=56036 RepID=A0AAD1Z6N3_9LAMI|nr:unnamed protein product [Fraxinus pennsylvanica]